MDQDLNLDSLFKKKFPIAEAIRNDYDNILESRCSNLFSISSKYQAIYIDSLGEIVITEINHSDFEVHFQCNDLRCFTFIDDDHIFGFYNSNFFAFDISSQEFQTKEENSLSITKITVLPSSNSENNNSFLILDDLSSKLIGLELMDGNTYNYFDLFSNVIDFSTTSSRVFVLYEKEAKLYEISNYQANEILSISINFPFPSHVQCTNTSYLIYFPYGYCVYDESGFKLNKDINKGKYICSMNCASVQNPDKTIVFCDEGKQEILFTDIKCVAILNKNLYYARNTHNIISNPLKITKESQHYYFAISNFATPISKDKIKKTCQKKFPTNYVYLTLPNQGDKKICLFDFDKRIELSDFKNNITKELFTEDADNILIQSLQPQNIDSLYLYFFCDEKFSAKEKHLPALISSINTNASVIFQDRVCMIDMRTYQLGVRTVTFLNFIYPELKLLAHIEDFHILSLVYPSNCNFPKNKQIKKTFLFDYTIQSHHKNYQILKFDSLESYEQALNTKIYQYDKKEAEIVPLVNYETYQNMENWKLRIRKLNKKVSKLDIYNHFKRYGLIYFIDMSEQEITIQFVHRESAEQAIGLNGADIMNSTICINYVKQRPEISFGKKQKYQGPKRKKNAHQNQEYEKQKQNNKRQNKQSNNKQQSNQQGNSPKQTSPQEQKEANNHHHQQPNDQQKQQQQNNNNKQQQNDQKQDQNSNTNNSNKFTYKPPHIQQSEQQKQNQQGQQQPNQNTQQDGSTSQMKNQNQQPQQQNQNKRKNNKFVYSFEDNQSNNNNNNSDNNSNNNSNSSINVSSNNNSNNSNSNNRNNNNNNNFNNRNNNNNSNNNFNNRNNNNSNNRNSNNNFNNRNNRNNNNNNNNNSRNSNNNFNNRNNNNNNNNNNSNNNNNNSRNSNNNFNNRNNRNNNNNNNNNNSRNSNNNFNNNRNNNNNNNSNNDNNNANNNFQQNQYQNRYQQKRQNKNKKQQQYWNKNQQNQSQNQNQQQSQDKDLNLSPNSSANIQQTNSQDRFSYRPSDKQENDEVVESQEFNDDDDDDDEGVVDFSDNQIQSKPNPFQDSSTTLLPPQFQPQKQPNARTVAPKIEKPQKKKILLEVAKKEIVYIFNHEKKPIEEIQNKYRSAETHELIDSPNSLDDRPIIKLTFSDEKTKSDFIRNNKNTASNLIRLFFADCQTLPEAINLRYSERKSFEPLMVRMSDIPPGTTQSEIMASLSQSFRSPIEYIELAQSDDGSLICDVGVKKKVDFNRLLRAASNVTINEKNVVADSYSQWIQDHQK